MKSKRFNLIIVLLILLVLVACSNNESNLKPLAKEGIKPYDLSDNDKLLLRSFGMESNSQIISFNAPKEINSLELKAYKLGDNKKWETTGSGEISIGNEKKPTNKLIGTFTMQLREDYVIEYNINTVGRASFKTDKIILDTEDVISTRNFLQEYQEIEVNKEIPVALMVYDSGTIMRTYSLEDYFNPIKFEGMDLVQVVTLKFN